MTIISHWLLILNSSCNIVIYLHKDPKFKAVAKEMFLSKLTPRMRSTFDTTTVGPNLADEESVRVSKCIILSTINSLARAGSLLPLLSRM
jgi:hypothetical protein